MTPLEVIVIIIAYLVGSISSTILLCRLLRLPDPREHGSKNPGTTNMLRIAGPRIAATVLILDVLKGFIIVWAVKLLFKLHIVADGVVVTAGFAAFMGQLYPIFFNFRGGKGVAIAIGIITAFYWQLSLLLLTIWSLVLYVFKISSLAALSATTVAIITTFWLPNKNIAIGIFIISLLILFKHIPNIKNLFNNTESKIK